jgi:SAM-dependent methyltransferase
MRWTIPYEFLYRVGRTPWDTGVTPPEVVELVEGKTPLPPGRALDLGCGTGNEVAYLARHGWWMATGVDLVQIAIDRAASRIEGLPNAAVRLGDVTKLGEMGLDGPSTWCSTWDAFIPFHPTDGMRTRRASVR